MHDIYGGEGEWICACLRTDDWQRVGTENRFLLIGKIYHNSFVVTAFNVTQ